MKYEDLKITPLDVADYLKTEEDRAGFLEAMKEESGNNPAMMAKALGTVARSRGMAEVAKASGLSRESLYKALSGERTPTIETFFRVAAAVGIELSYSPAHPKRKAAPAARRKARATPAAVAKPARAPAKKRARTAKRARAAV